MLGRGSPRLNMLARGSPRFNMILSKGAQKKKSPIATTSKTHGGSPKGIYVGSFLCCLCADLQGKQEQTGILC
jgi:hypothetical protein